MTAGTTLEVRIARRWTVADGVDAFELACLSEDDVLPAYEPGAHIDVHLPNGQVRQYSLCGRPEDLGLYRIAVLREPEGRGGSRCMHETVQEGQLIRISRPRQAFRLDPTASQSILLAGGVGITPILSMAYDLCVRNQEFELHLFARSLERAPFLVELEAPPLADRVRLHIDDAGQASPEDRMRAVLANSCPGTHVYVCGPEGFLTLARVMWSSLGNEEETFHFESFRPSGPSDDTRIFDVRIASSGLTVSVGPAETVISALGRHGVEIPYSCEQGVCGTCLTGIAEGVPDHRDQYLTDLERRRNDCFLPCCSRAKSSLLILDL